MKNTVTCQWTTITWYPDFKSKVKTHTLSPGSPLQPGAPIRPIFPCWHIEICVRFLSWLQNVETITYGTVSNLLPICSIAARYSCKTLLDNKNILWIFKDTCSHLDFKENIRLSIDFSGRTYLFPWCSNFSLNVREVVLKRNLQAWCVMYTTSYYDLTDNSQNTYTFSPLRPCSP